MLFWIWTVALVAAFVQYFREVFSRFSRYGVKHLTPIPFLGNTSKVLMKMEHIVDYVTNTYNISSEDRFVGTYELMKPKVMVRDLELIKNIAIKDFEHFANRRQDYASDKDAIFGRSIVWLNGRDWEQMRSSLRPMFSSLKIRNMMPFMVEAGEHMISYLQDKINKSEEGYIDIETMDLVTRYSNDVIASTAFGCKVNSFLEKHNQFYRMGEKVSNYTIKRIIRYLLYSMFPKLMNFIGLKLTPGAVRSFFKNLVIDTMKDREIRNVIRLDMIHQLMEAKKANKGWTEDELAAQVIIFLTAGYDSVSSTISLLLHEIAINPEVQKKLYKEIEKNEIDNEGILDYNSLQHMEYMDMVISEALRMYPTAILDRSCSKDYNLGRPNKTATKDYIIRKGEGIQIPVWAIHRDPQYYPEPLKFDPERFSKENKHNIKPYTYMPFGLGPRYCLGIKFALCEIKVLLYHFLKTMEISANSKTQVGKELSKTTINIRLKNGYFVRIRSRK